jgi:hypothetical protein
MFGSSLLFGVNVPPALHFDRLCESTSTHASAGCSEAARRAEEFALSAFTEGLSASGSLVLVWLRAVTAW